MKSAAMKKLFLLLSIVSITASAQEFTKAIEDNSYLIEEAYNQEDRVVQHIFNGIRISSSNQLESSFTQEWPAFGHLHQVSFTIPYQFVTSGSTAVNGLGDLLVHYRYQAMNENGFAVSPRASLVLPTGDEKTGLGNGVFGVQFNLPISKRFSNEIVTHYNAGLSVLPNVQFAVSKGTVTEYFIGGSAIYLATSNFNFMTEVVFISSGSKFGRTEELIFSPGLRWAVDIGDLQVVPGLAFPFFFSNGKQTNGIFLYMSFEHPY